MDSCPMVIWSIISIVYPSRKMLEQRILFLIVPIIGLPYVWSQSSNDTDAIQNQCPTNAIVNLTGGTLDEFSGFMVKNGYVFPPESRWIQDDDIFGCVCYNRPKCLPMYCPVNTTIYHKMNRNCRGPIYSRTDYIWILAIASIVYSVDVPIRTVKVIDRKIYEKYSDRDCDRYKMGLLGDIFQDGGIYIRRNGTVWIPQKNISAMYNFDAYCLCDRTRSFGFYFPCPARGIVNTAIEDYKYEEQESNAAIEYFDKEHGNTSQGTPVYPNTKCYKEHGNTPHGTTMVSHVGMIISIPFLLVTFIIYTILPELKNIHGLTLRGYVGCLLVAYTTLAVIQITGPISDVTCLVFAFTIYFSFLATCFWLNVMCFDIWWTFGDYRSLRQSVRKSDSRKFFTYSIYAWGFPILLTGICIIVTFVPGVSDNLITPEFERESICWFKTKKARAIYLYGPMGVTIITNIFFFVSTAVKIIKQKKDTARHLEGVDSERHDDNREWFNLYLKLFIVMGINWSMEIPAWLFEDLKYIWYITDLGNALQGLFIFIIFICKKNIKLLLVKRFGCHAPKFLSRDPAISTLPSTTAQAATNIAREP